MPELQTLLLAFMVRLIKRDMFGQSEFEEDQLTSTCRLADLNRIQVEVIGASHHPWLKPWPQLLQGVELQLRPQVEVLYVTQNWID